MKKLSILAFLSVLFFMTGCEEVETPDLGVDNQWLQFERSSYSINENAEDPLVVRLQYAADENPNGVTVNYSLETEYPDAFEITPEGTSGTLEIPAGEFEAFIYIDPIDNLETDGSKTITITIDNQDIPVGLNGEGNLNHETTVTILDNDCELDMASFVGNYLAEEDGYDVIYEVSVTYDEANDVLVLTNLYDTGGTTYISLDNSDPENPQIDFRSDEFDGVLYEDPTYGPGYASDPSDLSSNGPEADISSFRPCDQYMDLWFNICFPGIGCFTAPTHIQLTKI